MTERKVLVLGSTGYVGSRLIAHLVERGYPVRAVARCAESLRRRPWSGHPLVESFEANVFDLDALRAACHGCGLAYYLVHSMNPRHKNFAEADRQAAYNMIKAGAEGGLERIVYLGGLGEKTDTLSRHLRSRAEVGEILYSGKVPSTILRAAMIIGTGSASFEILRHLVERLPVMVTPRWVNTESQPIAIRNVLVYLTGCLENPDTAGQVFDIGGPDILSYRRLMDIFAQEAGLPRRVIIPVPLLTPRLSSYWVGMVTPVPASLGRPLAEGLCSRVVCHEGRIREIIPQSLIGCREAIRLALDPRQDKEPAEEPDHAKSPPCEWKYPGDPPWVGGRRKKN